jgi:hypothetical protein
MKWCLIHTKVREEFTYKNLIIEGGIVDGAYRIKVSAEIKYG